MITQIDAVKQVAEERCIQCQGFDGVDCPTCEGLRLRWPPLSRECPKGCKDGVLFVGMVGWTERPCDCGSGRVPDVTLEKVLDLLNQIGTWILSYDKNDHGCMGPQYSVRGDTPLEAACAALLAT